MIKKGLIYLVLIVGLIVAIGPFIITTLASFKTDIELVQGTFSLPHRWQFENYVVAWTQGGFSRFFINSLIVAVAVVIPSIILSCMSGYAFSRFDFKGARFLFAFLLLGLIVPLQAIVVPLFYVLKTMYMLNSYWGLILPQIALSLSFGTLLLRQAFSSVPKDITEAAIVDGASSWRILWWVLVPLIRPVIGTLGLLFFIWTWNEFLLPFVVTTDPQYQTLPVGLLYFQQRWTTNIPVTAAGATIIYVPLTVIFLIFQRQLIQGLTTGAVKG